ncbi:methylenetetrahydrofolate reductase [Thermanaeromonas sp. C210]|uniref:methylenetetrahydrofolate reductase n=1 Tax=Thermanaeromonas sp. C210 TaxID=2731925 RepID=UPI00155BB567|nr:methylenetetrahydrofolate reductase [Thermanaeromonas sp. C210]GFN23611.1 methylenetetrahydrofolate reductase [Thermanaeromonas sp. C210]
MGLKTESRLERLLSQGHFVVSGEIGPPKHASPEGILHHAELLKDYVDAANLTDNQTAIVRMSSMAAAVHVLRAGVEPIMQMTVRDRNRIALQSDLLGAYSLGIRNVLCLTGDHQSFGNHPTAKNVHDVDSIQLLKIVKDMRDDRKFACGEEIKEHEPRFFIGAAANPFADPFEFRVLRLEKKIKAGADFIQTQCIFDMERFERFMALVRERGLHKKAYILAGVMPLKSAKAARYMQKSVAGMVVPDEIVARMEKASDPRTEGVAICVEQIKHLRTIEGVAGVHIMAVMWEDIIPIIVKEAGLYPRPSAH